MTTPFFLHRQPSWFFFLAACFLFFFSFFARDEKSLAIRDRDRLFVASLITKVATTADERAVLFFYGFTFNIYLSFLLVRPMIYT